MLEGRARIWLSVGVTVLVLCVAGAVFAIQYAQAYAQCAAIPNPSPCAGVSTANIALDGLFVAVAGLLAAVVMGITTGINWRTNAPPNTALALRIAEEDEAFRQARARRAELQELNALALDHLGDLRAARMASGIADADAVGADGALTPGTPGAVDLLIEEEPQQETPDQARRRVLADRLRTLARNRPDMVAEVVQTWINQPRPSGRS